MKKERAAQPCAAGRSGEGRARRTNQPQHRPGKCTYVFWVPKDTSHCDAAISSRREVFTIDWEHQTACVLRVQSASTTAVLRESAAVVLDFRGHYNVDDVECNSYWSQERRVERISGESNDLHGHCEMSTGSMGGWGSTTTFRSRSRDHTNRGAEVEPLFCDLFRNRRMILEDSHRGLHPRTVVYAIDN